MAILVEGRTTAFILLIGFMFVIFYTVLRARTTGKIPWIRRLIALDAIEELVSRATEMGRDVVCGFGRAEQFNQDTLSGLSTLSYVARHTARLGAHLVVPMGGGRREAGPITIPIAQELVSTSYTAEGREEDFNDVEFLYFSPMSFTTAAATVALMQRRKPAAHIFVGQYFAEAIFLAEVTRAVGAMSVAGETGVGGNLACLAVVCDYVIIGEEVTAIGAYISEDPTLRSSIRATDMLKIFTIALMILGILAVQFGTDFLKGLLSL